MGRLVTRIFRKNHFVGAQDLWFRGIMSENVKEGDRVTIECTISCFVQVFPGNPYDNAERWNRLYSFQGKIDNATFQTLDFTAGSDSSLRVGSVNGESIIGIYNQYAYVGEGIIGIVPTKSLLKAIPEALTPRFLARRVLLAGRLSRCPAQHGFVVDSICRKAGINLDLKGYQNLWYVQVDWIRCMRGEAARYYSLLGSPWAATDQKDHQYLVTYGYLTDKQERENCIRGITASKHWKDARVYYDDIDCPSRELGFKHVFF